MKRLLFFVAVRMMATTLSAENVDQNRAKLVAQAFATQRERNMSQLHLSVVYSHPLPNKRDAAFYVVNLDNSGFVIVAANDVAHPVLGYSFERPWPTEGNLPPQVTDYLDDLAGQIEAAAMAIDYVPDKGIASEWQELLSINPNNSLQPKENRTEVGPLLTTTWDQGQYYNVMCPVDADGPDGHAVTGCVATAMAQIINYHQYPTSGRGIHNYLSNDYYELTVDFSNEVYDYTKMPDSLMAESSDEQINAVAQLIRDCGFAVNMQYSGLSSSAFNVDARTALINHFDYNSYASLASKDSYTNNDWIDMLTEEIDASRPIYYSGRGTGGHAFVCDGYNNDNYFHFNFGWSGVCDGWYLTSAISSPLMDFSSLQCAMVGIMPNSIPEDIVLGQWIGHITIEDMTSPCEVMHPYGHNLYRCQESIISQNIVTLKLADTTQQMVLDILSTGDWIVDVFDGETTDNLIQHITNNEGGYTPIVSSSSSMTIAFYPMMVMSSTRSGYHFYFSSAGDCRMVSNVTHVADATSIHLSWVENGTATQWEVEYGPQNHTLGTGVIETVDSTHCDITGLMPFNEYDAYIKPVCGGSWFGPISFMTDPPLWIDAVTEQPTGYSVVGNTVYISSVEGLAWWAKLANEYNDQQHKNVVITSDIDLYGKRWEPVNQYNGNIDGGGHVIRNMGVVESTGYYTAFIGQYRQGIISNIGFEDFVVIGYTGVATIVNALYDAKLKNCYARNGSIDAVASVGVLACSSDNSEIINCHSENVHWSSSAYNGGIVSSSKNSRFLNCYSFTTNEVCEFCTNGGIIGYSQYDEIYNCFSMEMPYDENQQGSGIVGAFLTNSYIQNNSIADIENSGVVLRDSIYFDQESTTDLLTALNLCVASIGDTTLRTWTLENNSVYPVFGDLYTNSCGTVTNITTKNTEINNEPTLKLSWMSDANSFVVKCTPRSHPNMSMYYDVDDTLLYVEGLNLGETYDIYVKAVCDVSNSSGWGYPTIHTFDKMYWNEVVTTQPEGYYADENDNIWISSAEGMAWFASQSPNLQNKTIQLTEDIDIGRYKWYSYGLVNSSFDGHGHSISGLYARENTNVSLFGDLSNSDIKNINVSGDVYANENAGGLFVWTYNAIVDNCHSSVNVNTIGGHCGSLGRFVGTSIVRNCSASGQVIGIAYSGGLLESSSNSQIMNCYATGNINIDTIAEDRRFYRGGLVGYTESSLLMNTYAIGRVDYDYRFSSNLGLVVGYADTCVVNSYGLQDSNGLWVYGLSASNPMGKNHDNSIFDEAGNLYTIVDLYGVVDTITVNGVVYEHLIDALNAWVDANNTSGEYLHWVADTANVNGGFPMLEETSSVTCQTKNLSPGWNWWSTYIELNGIDGLAMLEGQLGGNAVSINSQLAFTMYYEDFGWYGSLLSINNESMYRIKMNVPTTIAMTGFKADPVVHPITIDKGWNHIGFLLSEPMGVDDAFAGLESINLDIVKNQSSYATFYEDYGWYGSLTMGTINPGDGLMYKSEADESKTFTYPANPTRSTSMHTALDGTHWTNNAHAYPNNMTMLAVVEVDDTEVNSDNYELAAFVDDGCRGSVKLMYVEPIDRYVAFLTIAGDKPKELRFALYNRATGEEYFSNDQGLKFNTDAMVGTFTEPYVVRFDGDAIDGCGLIFYPNPTHDKLVVESHEPIRCCMVYSLVGQLVCSWNNCTDRFEIDVESLPAGSYLIQVVSDSFTATRKFVKN